MNEQFVQYEIAIKLKEKGFDDGCLAYYNKMPNHKEFQEYYERVEKLSKEGFHKGDLSWSDWHTYCLGSPGGGGQYVSSYTIGRVPDHAWWVTHEEETPDTSDDVQDNYYDDDY